MRSLGFADRLNMSEIVKEDSEVTPTSLSWYWKDEVIIEMRKTVENVIFVRKIRTQL